MSPSFGHDIRDQEIVDRASRILCPFRSSRQLALVLAEIDHTIVI